MKMTERPKVDFQLTFTVNEAEARALDALVGYDFDAFMKNFKEGMGKAYIEGHEEALRAVFGEFRSQIPNALSRLESARKVFTGAV